MNDIENLHAQVKELKQACVQLTDEKNKLGVMYEELQKEKTNLEKKMAFILGICEAYKHCIEKAGR